MNQEETNRLSEKIKKKAWAKIIKNTKNKSWWEGYEAGRQAERQELIERIRRLIKQLKEERKKYKEIVCPTCGKDRCGTERTIENYDFAIEVLEGLKQKFLKRC